MPADEPWFWRATAKRDPRCKMMPLSSGFASSPLSSQLCCSSFPTNLPKHWCCWARPSRPLLLTVRSRLEPGLVRRQRGLTIPGLASFRALIGRFGRGTSASVNAWMEKYLRSSVHTPAGCQPVPRASAPSDSTLYL